MPICRICGAEFEKGGLTMNRKLSLYIASRLLKIIGVLFDAVAEMFWWLWDKTSTIGDWCY